MATAYAALTSVMNTIEDIKEHPKPPITLPHERVDFLQETICFLLEFLEAHEAYVDLGMEIRIANAARTVEDLIESQIADLRSPRSEEDNIGCSVEDFFDNLQRAIQELGLINNQVIVEVNNKVNAQSQPDTKQPRQDPAIRTTSDEEKDVVGIEDLVNGVMDKLTRPHESGRHIIAMSGMGGIGKTTLARKVYEHRYIQNYFDIRAWVTVSKDFNTKEILLELLDCVGMKNMSQNAEHTLGEHLYKHLFRRRYLVIMDDVWDVEAWEKVRSFLPASKGSGIVITTRDLRVASISSRDITMKLLDDSKSWDLLRMKIFGDDDCPSKLEDVGKNIAKNCRGLPLSVVVIAGHLAKSSRTQEYWKYIAENLSSVVNLEDNKHCLKILSLSYDHLPIHLKPCFLYTGIFPEDAEIRVSRLIRLWVAEGFIKPISGKSSEDIGEGYLNDLVGRNLILESRLNSVGQLTHCKIHDLLRDFCVKSALETKFLCLLDKKCLGVTNEDRRVIVHPSDTEEENVHINQFAVQNSPPFLRTLLYDGTLLLLDYKLLRVLAHNFFTDNFFTELKEHGKPTSFETIHRLFNLRCIFDTAKYEVLGLGPHCLVIPPATSLLWNLKYLFIKGNMSIIVEAPPEIWEMHHLREVKIHKLVLPRPSVESNGNLSKNLTYVGRLINFSFSKEIVERIPNIKRLDMELDLFDEDEDEEVQMAIKEIYERVPILDEEADMGLENIALLTKLETLYCWCYITEDIKQSRMLRNLSFPQSLKKLSLNMLHWDDVTTKLGSLPLLEFLSLYGCLGSEWKLIEGQFRSLKHLEIDSCGDLQYLTADINHFPCLQSLYLLNMDSLKEISSGLGDIPTFKVIKLLSTSDSAVASLIRIAEEQYELGNEQLHVNAFLRAGQSRLLENSSECNFHIEDEWSD